MGSHMPAATSAIFAPFVLASASPRRQDLLRQIHIVPSEVVAADVDETPRRGEPPHDLTLRLALAKARAVAPAHPQAVILGADTVVTTGARLLPKAESLDEARECLNRLSGRRHRVITAVALVLPEGTVRSRVVTTTVSFKRLDADDMAHYLASGEWQGKAGGYAIQGLAAAFVRQINGSYSNVVGLPLFEVANLLRSAGIVPATGHA